MSGEPAKAFKPEQNNSGHTAKEAGGNRDGPHTGNTAFFHAEVVRSSCGISNQEASYDLPAGPSTAFSSRILSTLKVRRSPRLRQSACRPVKVKSL